LRAFPFESTKPTAVAIGHLNGEDFASRLDRAIERSRRPLMIEANREEHPNIRLRS
jgi:hypothetical protein